MNTVWRGSPLALGLLLAGQACCAGEAHGGSGSVAAEMRSEIRSEFGSAYHGGKEPGAPGVRPGAAGAGDRTGIVRMSPYVVNSAPNFDDLHRALVRQHAAARDKAICDKLGIAVHTVRLRKVTFAALTIFYIPVAVQVAW